MAMTQEEMPHHEDDTRLTLASWIGQRFRHLFTLSETEKRRIHEEAMKPWRTGYYVASRDWPASEPTGLTLDETYKALDQMAEAFPAAMESLRAEAEEQGSPETTA